MDNSPLRQRIFDLKRDNQQDLQAILLTLLDKVHALENPSAQPITVDTTKTAPTQANPSAVGSNICRMCFQMKEMFQDEFICRDCLAASTTPTTPPSSQSDPADMPSGPAEPGIGCAHERRFRLFKEDLSWTDTKNWWCQECGALMSHGRILVPAAATTSSTSVKQPSRH